MVSFLACKNCKESGTSEGLWVHLRGGGGGHQSFQMDVAVSCRGNIYLDEINLTIHTLTKKLPKNALI